MLLSSPLIADTTIAPDMNANPSTNEWEMISSISANVFRKLEPTARHAALGASGLRLEPSLQRDALLGIVFDGLQEMFQFHRSINHRFLGCQLALGKY